MTEFIAKAKSFKLLSSGKDGNGRNLWNKELSKEWHKGYYFEHSTIDGLECLIHSNHESVEVDKDTVCWKCPETPYFEHDIIKAVDDLTGDEVVGEILFFQGAFLFPIEEDELITVPNLIERGYVITLLGNSIDAPELLEQCTSKEA